MSRSYITFQIEAVPQEVARKFKRKFLASKGLLEQHLASTNLAANFPDPLSVSVTEYMPPISRALLPAWEGHRGAMTFASLRVRQGRAAIVHELSHVYAPNQARFLAEGLAVYLEETIGNLEAYPTCGISVENRLRDAGRPALQSINLATFDRVSVGNGRSLGESVAINPQFVRAENHGVYSYLVAGSFVRFLIASRGADKFKTLYEMTPLTPGKCTPLSPERYKVCLGATLPDLQNDWLEHSCRPTS